MRLQLRVELAQLRGQLCVHLPQLGVELAHLWRKLPVELQHDLLELLDRVVAVPAVPRPLHGCRGRLATACHGRGADQPHGLQHLLERAARMHRGPQRRPGLPLPSPRRAAACLGVLLRLQRAGQLLVGLLVVLVVLLLLLLRLLRLLHDRGHHHACDAADQRRVAHARHLHRSAAAAPQALQHVLQEVLRLLALHEPELGRLLGQLLRQLLRKHGGHGGPAVGGPRAHLLGHLGELHGLLHHLRQLLELLHLELSLELRLQGPVQLIQLLLELLLRQNPLLQDQRYGLLGLLLLLRLLLLRLLLLRHEAGLHGEV